MRCEALADFVPLTLALEDRLHLVCRRSGGRGFACCQCPDFQVGHSGLMLVTRFD